MISFLDALRLIQSSTILKSESRLKSEACTESVSLQDAHQRVLAAALKVPHPVPSFDNSSMDGFLVHSKDIPLKKDAAPVELRVLDSVSAGDSPTEVEPQKDAAFEIMTGAPIVKGAGDAVIKVEDVEVLEKNSEGRPLRIRIRGPVREGQFIRKAGSDLTEGSVFLDSHEVLTSEILMSLAALGISKIPVIPKPRVAVIATGAELVAPEVDPLPFGKIRDSSSIFLQNRLREMGFELLDLGRVGDAWSELEARVRAAVEMGVDLIVTTGAVSAGRHDFVKQLMESLGGETIFHKVAIKPGKPLLFGRLNSRTHYFGLPGNPVSTVVGVRFFINHWLRCFLQLAPEVPDQVKLSRLPESPLQLFLKAKTSLQKGVLQVDVLESQDSHLVGNFSEVNAWVSVAPGSEGLADVYPVEPVL